MITPIKDAVIVLNDEVFGTSIVSGLLYIIISPSTVPSSFTTNVTVSVDNSYPSGAIISLNVYLPGFNPSLIINGSLVDTQAYITSPVSSFNSRCAPGNSSPVVISLLLMLTGIGLSSR